jgi:ATP-dependent DNA helicase UvrD/PcrA
MRKISLKHTLPARLARNFDQDLNESRRAAKSPDGYNLIEAGSG